MPRMYLRNRCMHFCSFFQRTLILIRVLDKRERERERDSVSLLRKKTLSSYFYVIISVIQRGRF